MKRPHTILTICALSFPNISFSQFVAPEVVRALDFIKFTEPQTLADQIAICEIPAPPFKEEKRAAHFKNRFAELGLKNIRIDAVGNVIGERPGSNPKPMLILSAHLDTVFPEGTDVRVTRTSKEELR